MGDTSNDQDEVIVQEKVPKGPPSAETAVRSAKPSEQIAVLNKTPNTSQEKIQKIHEDLSPGDSIPKVKSSSETNDTAPKPEEKVQHKPDEKKPEDERKPLIDSLVAKPTDQHEQAKDIAASKSSPVTPTEKKTRVGSAVSGLTYGERINRNQSDIFSLKEDTSITSSIFSVNGSPSRKVFKRRELAANNVFPFGQKEEPPSDKPCSASCDKIREAKESYNELRRPSSSVRNPLTGTGLNSNDEYKFKGTKRKDGNPLLGLGYSPEATPSTHRIPPGGYSHKLW